MEQGNRISRQKLNNRLKELPLPVQEHCKRCKLIATFLLDRIKDEDWFYDTKLNADHIASAVFLHDIGKVCVPRESLYAEQNTTKAKQKLYRSHVEEGVLLVESECGINLSSFSERRFESYVRQAITEHHECEDGCGFPQGLRGQQISLTGKITAIADTVDNLFFVGSSELGDVEEKVDQLATMAGIELDKKLLRIMLKDRAAFAEFIRYIDARYRTKRKTDNYGLQLLFRPIRNIIANADRAFLTEFVINDPFYGIVRPEVFLPVTNMSSQTLRITMLMMERLFIMIDHIRERGGTMWPVTVAVEAQCFARKKFAPDLIKLLKKYSIKSKSVCLMVDEKGLLEQDEAEYTASFAALRNGGFNIALKTLGGHTTLLSAIDSLQVDYLFIDPNFTHKLHSNANAIGIATGVLEMAENLYVSTVFLGSDTGAVERELLKLRAKFAAGELYGEPLRENEMVSLMVNAGGDTS